LFPHLAGVSVERVVLSGRVVRIGIRASGSRAACPACGTVSRRVHSRYERRLSDLAVSGQEVMLELSARRFFCVAVTCEKATFAEQVPGLTVRYGRRSAVLTEVLRAVALALGGRAGARMSARLAAEVSRVTLIRLIRALPEPAVTPAPRVVGVDEFALRRGHSDGTLLVDVETRRPVDVLPERSADSFAAWLAARPGAELICRDRAGCYADGGTRGAPDAVQVADRWHLWHNLGDAVERAVARHSGCLRAAVTALLAARPPQLAETSDPAAAGPERSDRIAARTRERHAVIRQLLADGRTVRAAAAELGLARNTVRRFARAASPEELLVRDGTGRRASILDEHRSYLRERWNAGCTDAVVLHRELRARGYRGGYSLVRDYLAPFRGTAIPAPAPAVPRTRAVTRWIMTRPASLLPADQAQLDAILQACPELAAVTTHVRGFASMMTSRRGRDLQKWMTSAAAASDPALASFVTGLRSDQDAVTAALTLMGASGSPAPGEMAGAGDLLLVAAGG
jgi:transposase